jgi:hypothetical protein
MIKLLSGQQIVKRQSTLFSERSIIYQTLLYYAICSTIYSYYWFTDLQPDIIRR